MSVIWKVREVAEARGVSSAAQLAVKAGLNKNTANGLWNGSPLRIDRDTLAKLCAALDCTAGELLEYVRSAAKKRAADRAPRSAQTQGAMQ